MKTAPFGGHPDLAGCLVAVDDHLRPVFELEGDDIAGAGDFQIHVGVLAGHFDAFGERVEHDADLL